MSTGIKPLEQSYLTGVFDQLGKLEVHLDSDPLVYGPKRLNLKTALVRKMLTDCERVFLQISQTQANYKRQHRAAKVILDIELKRLLANDPHVRAGRAVSEREAIAYGMLSTEVQEVADAENALEELDAVMAVVKAKRSDLRDIQGRLRDQVRLCQEEIGLGSRWGSKHPRGVELQPGQGFADGSDIAAIEAVIQTVREVSDSERHLKAEVDDTDSSEEELEALVLGMSALATDDDEPVVEEPEVPRRSAVRFEPSEPLEVVDRRSEPPEVVEFEPEVLFAPDMGRRVDFAPIPGENLVGEFGFVPHCAECGEVQMKTAGGMVCSKGHGGADSVPPAEDLLGVGDAPVKALVETTDQEAVAEFLGLVDTTPATPKKSRYQVEEEDGMDLDSILDQFNS